MIQKFKRGNKVRVLKGHEILTSDRGVVDISPERIGQEAVIIGSYADQFGGNDHKQYSIMFLENGSKVSWFNEKDLEFLEEGGENLIEQGQAKRDSIKKENTDLTSIVTNWATKKEQQHSDTILYLFDKIGFTSSFLKHGEFFNLWCDWEKAYPLFELIMIAEKDYDITKVLVAECTDTQRTKIAELFNEVKSIQSSI